jgi:hypothetical protein
LLKEALDMVEPDCRGSVDDQVLLALLKASHRPLAIVAQHLCKHNIHSEGETSAAVPCVSHVARLLLQFYSSSVLLTRPACILESQVLTVLASLLNQLPQGGAEVNAVSPCVGTSPNALKNLQLNFLPAIRCQVWQTLLLLAGVCLTQAATSSPAVSTSLPPPAPALNAHPHPRAQLWSSLHSILPLVEEDLNCLARAPGMKLCTDLKEDEVLTGSKVQMLTFWI